MRRLFRYRSAFAMVLLSITVLSLFYTNFSLLDRLRPNTSRSPASVTTSSSFPFTLPGRFTTLVTPTTVNKPITDLKEMPPHASFTYSGDKLIDFTGDGVPDRVRCSINKFVQIIDGKTNKLHWEWVGPQIKSQGSTKNLALTSCDVVLLDKGHPAVFISTLWSIPGWFAAANQFMVYKKGAKSIVARQIKNPSTFGPYQATARSVQCAPYPQALVKRGFKAGALCFYSAYESLGKTHTSLFKIDLTADKEPVFRDITASSGLMWTGGARGTPKSQIPSSQKCSGKSTRDGLFMMSGTFVDFNRDGFIDLISLGQHASIRAHQMTFDAKAAQGIKFKTSIIHKAGRGATQEFLRVTALNKFDPKVPNSCVHVSGEMYDGGSCGGGMRDQIICFNKAQARWEKTNLPGPVSSEFVEPRAWLAGDKKTTILAIRKRNNNSTYENRYFRLHF